MRSAKQSRPSGHLRPIMHSRATIFSAGKLGQAVGGDICGSQTVLVCGAALGKAGVGRRGIRTVHMVMPAVCGVEPDGAADPVLVNYVGLSWCVISPFCPLCDVHSKPMHRSHFADTCYVFFSFHTETQVMAPRAVQACAASGELRFPSACKADAPHHLLALTDPNLDKETYPPNGPKPDLGHTDPLNGHYMAPAVIRQRAG